MRYKTRDMRCKINFCKQPAKRQLAFLLLLTTLLFSCQKELKLKYGVGEIKQVINCNFSPDSYLYVNISKSKQPNDFSSVEFLTDCKVDLYEDDVFIETMPFVLKDTLSNLGYYTSSYILQQNKTYKIISTHPQLGVTEASEYLPPYPDAIYTLGQHADSLHTPLTGRYSVIFQDSINHKNYYYIAAFYRILKPVVNKSGDTTYKYDYLFNIPSSTPEIPNTVNYPRSYFTDAAFNGQLKGFDFTFPSQYNNIYKEITLIIEFSNLGENYYDWNTQQLPKGTDFLNEGQLERINLSNNIKNGYGHFSASSSSYSGFKIK